MAQIRNIIPLVFQVAPQGEAIATGNNAAWHCICDKKPIQIGRTGLLGRITEGYVVECLECGARYFVEPRDHDQDVATRVIEI